MYLTGSKQPYFRQIKYSCWVRLFFFFAQRAVRCRFNRCCSCGAPGYERGGLGFRGGSFIKWKCVAKMFPDHMQANKQMRTVHQKTIERRGALESFRLMRMAELLAFDYAGREYPLIAQKLRILKNKRDCVLWWNLAQKDDLHIPLFSIICHICILGFFANLYIFLVNLNLTTLFLPGTARSATISLLAFGFQRSRQKPIKNYAPQANDANEEEEPKIKNKKIQLKKKQKRTKIQYIYAIDRSGGAASVQRGRTGMDRRGMAHRFRLRSRSSILGPRTTDHSQPG